MVDKINNSYMYFIIPGIDKEYTHPYFNRRTGGTEAVGGEFILPISSRMVKFAVSCNCHFGDPLTNGIQEFPL